MCIAAAGSHEAVAGGREAVHPRASRDEGANAAAADVAADAAAGQEQPQARHQAVEGVPPLLAADADAVAAAAKDEENKEPEPHLRAWRRCHAEKSKRAYLTALFADGKRHLVVGVLHHQAAQYKQLVHHLQQEAMSKNYTKQATVACRDRLLKEGHWGAPFPPAAHSDPPPDDSDLD